MILSPEKPNQETQAIEEITSSPGTEARSEETGKCRKRRRKGLSGRVPNLVETTQNYTTSDHDHLCEELIVEIFTRLPAKSLLRFRSVSKSLCRCICSPGFIRMHASRSPQKVLIRHEVYKSHKNVYTLHSEDQLPVDPRPGYNGIKEVWFLYSTDIECAGSYNGIFCIRSYRDDGIFLWNPSIRRKLKVPDCPARFGGCWPGMICYNDMPNVRIGKLSDPIGLRFGYDTITDDYKIVSLPIFGHRRGGSYVYTMKTGAWCAIASPAPSFYQAKSRGCFVNGALHWVVQRYKVAHSYILTFNLSTHILGKIVLPEPEWETKQLTTIQGSLAAVSTKHDDHDSWIWVMKEYNNDASWFVLFTSKTNQVKGQLGRVLQPTSNGDLFFYISREGFQVYDPNKRTRSRLQRLRVYSSIMDMESCIDGLTSLDRYKGRCYGIEPVPGEENQYIAYSNCFNKGRLARAANYISSFALRKFEFGLLCDYYLDFNY